mgnify:CR=1 FL=1|jgi:hypothetical protein
MLAHSTVFETAAQPSSTPENPQKLRPPDSSKGFHSLIEGSNHGQFHGQAPRRCCAENGVSIRLFPSLGGCPTGTHNGISRIPVIGVVWPRGSCWELDAVLQPGRQPCFIDIVGCQGEHCFDSVIGVGPPVVP